MRYEMSLKISDVSVLLIGVLLVIEEEIVVRG